MRRRRRGLWRRTALECLNVWRAKHGNDPYGMLLKDRPWPEVVRRTYRSHRAWLDGECDPFDPLRGL